MNESVSCTNMHTHSALVVFGKFFHDLLLFFFLLVSLSTHRVYNIKMYNKFVPYTYTYIRNINYDVGHLLN